MSEKFVRMINTEKDPVNCDAFALRTLKDQKGEQRYPALDKTQSVTMSMSLVTELARSDTEELARRPGSSGF